MTRIPGTPTLMHLPPVPIANIDAFLAAIGQWNLYDMEIRGVRFDPAATEGPTLDLVLALPGDGAPATAIGADTEEHEFVFRFSGIESLDLVGFGRQNVIGEHEFTLGEPGPDGTPLIFAEIDGTVGGSMRCLCRRIAVADVHARRRGSTA